MTPTIITDNTTLHQYLPNTVTEVEGERTLFDKMTPDIIAAEQFFTSEISSLEAIGSEDVLFTMAKRIVAYRALMNAIPKLDLILTDNGFGIVSNGSVAPASKDRVDRLIASLDKQLGEQINAFLHVALSIDAWRATDGKRHMQTIFCGMDIEDYLATEGNIYTAYKSHLPIIQGVQNYIAHDFISEQLMQQLIDDAYRDDESDAIKHVRSMLHPVVCGMVKDIKSKEDHTFTLKMVVDFIRKHPTDFPDWPSSYAGKRYQDLSFKNDPKASAFWL